MTPAEHPLPASPPYHTPSTTPVVEGEPHIVYPTLIERTPTPAPGQRRAEVDEESEEDPEHLQPIVPFIEPPSITPSPRTEGIRIAPSTVLVCEYERRRQDEQNPWVGLLPSHYKEQRAIHLETIPVLTSRSHYYTFILKVVQERHNPRTTGNSPLSFCHHPHHLYYLSI
jgi:hypothetical protein